MTIPNFTVQNDRSIRLAKCDHVPKLMVIAGPNGSGKSTLINAWPGNVRELRNIVERLAILCDQDRIEPHHLPEEIRKAAPRTTVSQLPQTWEEFKQLKQQVRDAAVDQLERRFLTEALQRCDGNVSRAAEEDGIQRTNLHALMRKHGLNAE